MAEIEPREPTIIEDRIYGEIVISDPCVQELIQSEPLKRLKCIAQMGVYGRALPHIDTTRFEHSVGVYHLLQKFGSTREEQIAGLLHDVSHTAFSHVNDHLRGTSLNQEWQDNEHVQFVFKSGIPEILKHHHIRPGTIVNYHRYPLLEQPLPQLCADRLDYGLRDAVVCGVLPPEYVDMILGTLTIIDNRWVFKEPTIAEYYFEKSIQMARDWWAPPWGVLQFQSMANALKVGLAKGFIAEDDLFTTDQEVWNKLENSRDPEILTNLDRVKKVLDLKYEIANEPPGIPIQSKYRGTDPLVQWQGKLMGISTFYPTLQQIADEVKREIEGVKYIRLFE